MPRSRRLLIAANWKMNSPPPRFEGGDSPYQTRKAVDVVVFPTFLDVQRCVDAELETGAQWGHPAEQGAHTGDVSMRMIAETGAAYVLCGHSERRRSHGETDAFVVEQARVALTVGLQPVVCIGETQEERDAGTEKDVIRRQMQSLPEGIIIAYEPVWAIGTGKNATAAQAQEMHGFIRSSLPAATRDRIRILYGGSMNGQNAEELLRQADIDGGLIGGASLKPEEFATIVDIASHLASHH